MRVGTVVQRRRAQICARLHAVQTAYSCAEWVDCSSHTCRRSGFVPHRRLRRERVSFSQMLADSGSRHDMYVMDYGASGGWRLALNHPERVMGLIKRDLPDVELHLLDTGLRPG